MDDKLVDNANMPMPKLCMIPDKSPNAFATGRNENHATIAVTSGIIFSTHPPFEKRIERLRAMKAAGSFKNVGTKNLYAKHC
jgi:Zn-dependent protease with chaperone function